MFPISPNISPSSSTANVSTLSSDDSSGEYEWADALPEFENPWTSSDQETDPTFSKVAAESSTKDKMACITSLAGKNLQPPTKPEQQANDLETGGKEVFTPRTIRFSSSLRQIPFTQNSQSSNKPNPLLRLVQQNEPTPRSTSSITLMPNDSPFRAKAEQFSIPSNETASEKLKNTRGTHDSQKTMSEDKGALDLKPEQQSSDLNAARKQAFTPKTMRFSSSLQQMPFTQNSQGSNKPNHPLRFAQQNEPALRSTSSTTLMPNDSPFRAKAEQLSIPSSKTASDKLNKTQEIHDCQEIRLEGDWTFNLDTSEAYEIAPENDSRSNLDETN